MVMQVMLLDAVHLHIASSHYKIEYVYLCALFLFNNMPMNQ